MKKIYRYSLILFTLLGALAGVLAFLAGYLSPAKFPSLSLWGLAMPGILLVNVLLLLCWVLRRRYEAFIPGSVLLLNIGYILSVFQISLFTPRVAPEALPLKVASYNVKTFRSWSGGFPTQFDITGYFQQQGCDIVCFQEFYNAPLLNADSLGVLLELPYNTVGILKSTKDLGTAIFSKYPIVQSGVLDFGSQSNQALWADLLIQDQTVRVLNCHLETTSFNQKRKDIDKYAHADVNTQLTVYENISDVLVNNNVKRALQADMLRHFIDTTTHPILVCGDFNDPPSSYTYHRIKGKLKDSFRQQGNGYAYTYRGMRHLFRIDYIFYSQPFQCISYRSEEREWSDHNPIISEIILNIQ